MPSVVDGTKLRDIRQRLGTLHQKLGAGELGCVSGINETDRQCSAHDDRKRFCAHFERGPCYVVTLKF
jgi:hypothetical protein